MYDDLIKQVHTLAYLVGGSVLVWDCNDNQIIELQQVFIFERTFNYSLLKRIAENAQKIYIGKWREWTVNITFDDFMEITNIRTILEKE